ncbi:MAG TPA: hypothetical protein VGK19_21910 [Capsulimonadaceae bacterium]|jgi:hypothetical protein
MRSGISIIVSLAAIACASLPAHAYAVDAYGYDNAGRYHTDGYANSSNLNLNTNIDVSDLKAKFAKSFAPSRPYVATPWYNSAPSAPSYTPPAPREKGVTELFMEDKIRKAAAGDLDSLIFLGLDSYFLKRYADAIRYWQKGADLGSGECRGRLYDLLREPGTGFQDLDRAATLLPKLAEVDSTAMEAYGQALIAGDHFPKDVERGIAFREKAAEIGISKTQLALAYDYETGSGIPADNKKAIKWYARALFNPHTVFPGPANDQSMKLMTMILADKDGIKEHRDDLVNLFNDDVTVLLWLDDKNEFGKRIAAALQPGAPPARNYETAVGLLLTDTRLGPPDYARAVGFLTTLSYKSPNDDPLAKRQLAVMYENGWGVERDHARAMSMLAPLASQDSVACRYLASDQIQLWHKYQAADPKSFETEHAEREALRYAKSGARRGDMPCQIMGAQLLQYDAEHDADLTADEKRTDYTEAYSMLKAASDAGEPKATYLLGVATDKGYGTTKDRIQAMTFYQIASDAGQAQAQRVVGNAVLYGLRGRAQDTIAGRKLLQAAAKQDPGAANDLALWLWNFGKGPTNADDVKTLLSQALDDGYWMAGINLAKFYHSGFEGMKDESMAKVTLDVTGKMAGKESALAVANEYTTGDAVDADPAVAAKWKAIAAGR